MFEKKEKFRNKNVLLICKAGYTKNTERKSINKKKKINHKMFLKIRLKKCFRWRNELVISYNSIIFYGKFLYIFILVWINWHKKEYIPMYTVLLCYDKIYNFIIST